MKKRYLISFILFLLINLSAKAQLTGHGWEWASVSGTTNDGKSVRQLTTDAAGNVYVAGYFHGGLTLGSFTVTGTKNGSIDLVNVFIAKYDAIGNIIWLKKYDGKGVLANVNCNSITLDGSGSIYVGGFGLSTTTTNSAFLIKYDNNGNILWRKEDFPLNEVNGVNIGPDGNPLVMESNLGAKNIYKLNKTNGNIIWTASCTGAGSSGAFQDFTDNVGNVYFDCFNMGGANVNILGDTYTSTGGFTDFFSYVASVDNNGVKRWTHNAPYSAITSGFTVDANGKTYIQMGGFGGTFLGISTSQLGYKYFELDNTGAISRYLKNSPYKGSLRVKSDGIYAIENNPGSTIVNTVVYGNYFYTIPADNSKSEGVIIKYNASTDQVIYANSIAVNGTLYKPGGIVSFDTSPGGKIVVGGNFGSTLQTNTTTYNTASSGYSPYDLFVAKFDGSNTALPPSDNWTGVANNGSWIDATNWDNGIPSGNEKSIIPAGLTSYPSNIPTTAITGKLQVDAGASIDLPVAFAAGAGLMNNGKVTIIGTGFFQGINTGKTPISGSGILVFTTASPSYILYAIPQSLEINKPSGTISYSPTDLGGSLFLTNGKLAVNTLNISDPNATITYSPTSYISSGTLKRVVNATGDYTFPMGSSSSYNPVTIHLNNVVGPQNFAVSFNPSLSGTTPNLTFGASTISTLLNTGSWNVKGDAAITSGSYTLDLEAPNYTNGITDPTKYLIINRDNANTPWSLKGKKLSSTQAGGTISGSILSNGLLDISSEKLTEFNDFAIGIGSASIANGTENGNTNWTGNAGNSLWTDAGNWDNGVPTSGTNVIIQSGKTTYPQNIIASNTAAKLQVDAGVNIKLPSTFIATAGIINNGQIEVTGTDNFAGFGNTTSGYSILSGNGKLLFNSIGPIGSSASINNDVEISGYTNFNAISSFFNKNVLLSNGTSVNGFTMANPNATLTTTGNSYITSSVIRFINATGTYNFPYDNGAVKFSSNSLMGATSVTVTRYSIYGGDSAPNFTYNSEIVNKYLNNGYYFTVQANGITSGTYAVGIDIKGASNALSNASKYLLINRSSASYPWKFNGVAGTTSQNGNVSSAASTGLNLATAQYAIGIVGIVNSNWTGAANNGVWANAGNWDNGIPNSSIKAAFASGLSSYPLTFPTAPSTESVSIESGANVKLAYDMVAPLGVVNNGTIEPIGSGTFTGFGSTTSSSIISGSGTVLFTNSSPGTLNGLIGNNIEINKTGSITSNHASITGNYTATNGNINSPLSNEFTLVNPNATITLASSANYFYNRLNRNVNPTGSYFFPVGYSSLDYCPVTISTNGVTGPTNFGVFYNRVLNPDYPNIFADGIPVLKLLNCDWILFANTAATAGTLNITFTGRNYNNGGVDNSRYVLLRKVGGGPLGYEVLSNYTITENAGVITASITGLTPSINADYYIGVKGLTTTWTGAANDQNWDTAANWDFGVPNGNYFAKFIAGTANYPLSITSSANAAALSIATGVTLKISEDFNASYGIINNGTIEVTGSSNFAGFNNGYTPLSGSGKLIFGASGPAGFSIYSSLTLNNDVEISKGGTFPMTATIGGSLTLSNTIVSGAVTMTNPLATINYSPTGYIAGTLKRVVNPYGDYSFPIGTTTRFAPIILHASNMVGPQSITTSFVAGVNGSAPNTTAGGRAVNTLLNSGIWTVTPNVVLTGGNYAITLEGRSFTNGVTDAQASNYVVVKRPNFSGAWAFYGDNGTSSQNGGVAIATAGNITGFSDFAIGIASGDVPTTLPIKLVNFTAKTDGKASLLTWRTSTEINNDRFEIERSSDGLSWIKIGEVKGAGNNYQLKNYIFRDIFPVSADNYYRLKQFDINGAFEYSPIKSVNFNLEGDNQLSFYPNPAKDEIHLKGFRNNIKEIIVVDLSGKLIFSKSFVGESLKLPKNLQDGNYIIKVKSGDEILTKILIVKN
jgi:hypothetical protein